MIASPWASGRWVDLAAPRIVAGEATPTADIT